MRKRVITGVSDHGGWAVLVTAGNDGAPLDRRRIELVDDSLPGLPHHHDGQMMPIEQAVTLVERVRESAERHATSALETLAGDLPQIQGIALRNCPPLPATIAERITTYPARNLADWVMYRKALASAAEARGWSVQWFDTRAISRLAADALRIASFDEHFRGMRAAAGPPWNADVKVALAAAIVAANALA